MDNSLKILLQHNQAKMKSLVAGAIDKWKLTEDLVDDLSAILARGPTNMRDTKCVLELARFGLYNLLLKQLEIAELEDSFEDS